MLTKTDETTSTDLKGSLDGAREGDVYGWAVLPHKIVELVCLVDGDFVGEAKANLPREDLAASGLPDCAFEIELPEAVCDGKAHTIELRIAGTETAIFDTPVTLTLPKPAIKAPVKPISAAQKIGQAGLDALKQNSELADYVDVDWYKQTHDDVVFDRTDPVEHYFSLGWLEGRAPNAFFDPEYYAERAGLTLGDQVELEHYVSEGWKAGLSPSPKFSTLRYMHHNIDVTAFMIEPLRHYLLAGRFEERTMEPLETSADEVALRPTPGEFFGNPHLDAFMKNRQTKLTQTQKFYNSSYDPTCLDIHWIIPDFAPGAGGHMSIFKTISWLEFIGHKCTIWINHPTERSDSHQVKADIMRYFRPIKSQVRLIEPMTSIEGDIIVLTDHNTVWTGLKQGQAKKFFYYVQDFEPYFFPAGTQNILAEETYKLDLPCYCSSPWLEERMKSYGNTAESFTYPCQPDIYFPASEDPDWESKTRKIRQSPHADEDTLHIAFYGRHFTYRRAVDLGVLALTKLYEKNPNILVHVFGQDWDPAKPWPFPVKLHGVMKEKPLADLYRACDFGFAISATNYNIAAVDMMACGLPVVDIDVDSTRSTFPADTITLAPPHPDKIADALDEFAKDRKRWAKQAAAAGKWVRTGNYEQIARKFSDFMLRELKKTDYKAVESEPKYTENNPFATVVIPTYNPGESIRGLLDIVLAQRAPWPFEVLIIDSASSDGSIDIYKDYPDVRVIPIQKNEFSHGGTRNRAIAAAKGEYIAFLTQDAIPTDEFWLFHLAGCLDSVDGAACAYGRHFAHLDATEFTKHELQECFDNIAATPCIQHKDTHAPEFRSRDPNWTGVLRFFSDNNSCYRKSVWQRLRLRDIDFGEDQAYAWDAICAGYSKVYVDAAAVYHSHEYTPEETYERSRTETLFYKDVFNTDVSIRSQDDYEGRLRLLNGKDIIYAIKNQLCQDELMTRLSLNDAQLHGKNIRGIPLKPVYDYQDPDCEWFSE